MADGCITPEAVTSAPLLLRAQKGSLIQSAEWATKRLCAAAHRRFYGLFPVMRCGGP